jgi:CheY-like chemotaxis protein
MPRMTGDEVISEIRKRGMDCRVVPVTTVDPDFDIIDIDIDFDEHLTKPVMCDDIEGVLDRLETLAAEVDPARQERDERVSGTFSDG